MSATTFHALPDTAVDHLHSVIQVTNDSIEGLHAAARRLHDERPELAHTFDDIAEQRETVAADLNAQLAAANEGVDSDGTMLGTLHREWLKLRDIVSRSSANAVLDEALRGEHELRKTYQDALECTLGTPLYRTLTSAYSVIEAGIRQLEDANCLARRAAN